ncbi:hypothetical protein D3C72_1577200 [compost metagenome]
MSDEKVINRVKKLLALAVGGANANESESALLLAQRMMAENNIALEDVEGQAEAPKPRVVQHYATYAKGNSALVWYAVDLARVIAKNFRVKHVVGVSPQKSKSKAAKEKGDIPQSIIFVGIADDVMLAVEVYQFALESVKHHADRYARKLYSKGHPMTGLRGAFTTGYLKGLREKFEEQVKTNNWLAIITLHPAVVEYFDEMSTGTISITANKNQAAAYLNGAAFEAGRQEGKRFDANVTKLT